MALVAGGSTLFSSIMGGQSQAAQAQAQQAQFEWGEFTRRMDTQIKNRQIAKQNAARWQNNRNIEKAANKTRAEEEFWLRYNFDNETGSFSRNARQANDQLVSHMAGKNINTKSQTAKALLRQSLDTNKEFLVNRRVAFGNAMLSAKRRQDSALASRDFGYTDHVTFMAGENFQPSSSSIMKNALIQGVVGGAMAGIGAYGMADFAQTQANLSQNALNMPAVAGHAGGGLGGVLGQNTIAMPPVSGGMI